VALPALVTTPAASTANAYIDLTEADTFAEAEIGPFAKKWRESDDIEEKTRAILSATRDIERFIGRTVALYDPTTPQALMFPRIEDQLAGTPYVPSVVKRATFVQALFLFTNATTIDNARSQRARGLSNFSEPNVSGSLATDSSWQFSPDLDSLLVEYREGAVVGWIVPT
jgi:hypothetical protein